MSTMRTLARLQYESRLAKLEVAKGEIRDQIYYELQGYVNGLYWGDVITDEEYFAMDQEVFEAWTTMNGRITD